MQIAIYGRVSTSHQVDHQTIEQQLGRLSAHVHAAEGWVLDGSVVLCCMDRIVHALIHLKPLFKRCGRISGVRARACGSRHKLRW